MTSRHVTTQRPYTKPVVTGKAGTLSLIKKVGNRELLSMYEDTCIELRTELLSSKEITTTYIELVPLEDLCGPSRDLRYGSLCRPSLSSLRP